MSPTSIFLSYKRDEEVRVAKIAQVLEQEGFNVWWDAHLQPRDSWAEQIDRRIDEANAVLVCWSRVSADTSNINGAFVRDEARRAFGQGKLVAALIDPVTPPTGLSEVQCIDLTHWKGKASDPFFQDLVATLRAVQANEPPPPQKGRAARLRKILFRSSAAGILAAFVAVFANVQSLQDTACSAPILQPSVSDACGELGLGDKPTHAERISWESMPRRSCEALRAHIRAFPQGVYHDEADALLSTIRYVPTERFAPVDEKRPGYVRQGATFSASETAALADVRTRAEEDARKTICRPADASERLRNVSIERLDPDCRSSSPGTGCSADYEAICHFERQVIDEQCG